MDVCQSNTKIELLNDFSTTEVLLTAEEKDVTTRSIAAMVELDPLVPMQFKSDLQRFFQDLIRTTTPHQREEDVSTCQGMGLMSETAAVVAEIVASKARTAAMEAEKAAMEAENAKAEERLVELKLRVAAAKAGAMKRERECMRQGRRSSARSSPRRCVLQRAWKNRYGSCESGGDPTTCRQQRYDLLHRMRSHRPFSTAGYRHGPRRIKCPKSKHEYHHSKQPSKRTKNVVDDDQERR